MNLHEKIGRQQVALDDLNVEYDRLLDLTRQLASGEIEPARVTVDMQARTWTLTPEAPALVELPPLAINNH